MESVDHSPGPNLTREWGWSGMEGEAEPVVLGERELCRYSDQVAGARPVLQRRADSGELLKAAEPQELAFYAATATARLRPFVPRLLGLALVVREATEEEEAEPVRPPEDAPRLVLAPRANPWPSRKPFFPEGAGAGQRLCLRLENLSRGMALPCIMDLKVGTSNAYPNASTTKLAHKAAKREHCATLVAGLRLCMRQAWCPRRRRFEASANKAFGWRLSIPALRAEVRAFAHPPGGIDRRAAFAAKTEALAELLAGPAGAGARFYTTSLLLLYDAADVEPLGVEAPDARLHLIDFAHADPPSRVNPGDGPHVDFLFGLRNLVRILNGRPLALIPPS